MTNLKNKRKKFWLHGKDFYVEIYFHHGFGHWVGEILQSYTGSNYIEHIVSHQERKMIPRMIRSKVAEVLNSEIRKVKSKINGQVIFTENMIDPPLPYVKKSLEKDIGKDLFIPKGLIGRLGIGFTSYFYMIQNISTILNSPRIIFESADDEEAYNKYSLSVDIKGSFANRLNTLKGGLNGRNPKTVIIDEFNDITDSVSDS